MSAYTQFSFMESTSRDETAGGSTGPGKELLVPLNNPFVVNNPGLQTILGLAPARSGQSRRADAAAGAHQAADRERQPHPDLQV